MWKRLQLILKSLQFSKRIEEQEVSTTVDDTQNGDRTVFDKTRVDELLRKCDLLEKTSDNS